MPTPRAATRCIVAGLLLASTLPAMAGKMYQWKDAKGVTHYTDTPPEAAHTTRKIKDRPAPPAPAKPVVSAGCTNARSNLTLLQGTAPVGIDENQDGKPDRTLTDSERTDRRKLAEAQVQVFCGASLDNRG